MSKEALTDLIRRIERHVDFECGADGRYAFMGEVRTLFGPLVPPESSREALVRRLITSDEWEYNSEYTHEILDIIAREWDALDRSAW
jgi:hypothetical protein